MDILWVEDRHAAHILPCAGYPHHQKPSNPKQNSAEVEKPVLTPGVGGSREEGPSPVKWASWRWPMLRCLCWEGTGAPRALTGCSVRRNSCRQGLGEMTKGDRWPSPLRADRCPQYLWAHNETPSPSLPCCKGWPRDQVPANGT